MDHIKFCGLTYSVFFPGGNWNFKHETWMEDMPPPRLLSRGCLMGCCKGVSSPGCRDLLPFSLRNMSEAQHRCWQINLACSRRNSSSRRFCHRPVRFCHKVRRTLLSKVLSFTVAWRLSVIGTKGPNSRGPLQWQRGGDRAVQVFLHLSCSLYTTYKIYKLCCIMMRRQVSKWNPAQT